VKKAIKFLKDNKWVFLQMGLMLLPMAIGYANDADKAEITALQKPMAVLQSTFTGAIPKVGVTVAAAAGATSWALGTESQVTKLALRCAMGGGVAMAAPSAITSLTGTTVSGCLF